MADITQYLRSISTEGVVTDNTGQTINLATQAELDSWSSSIPIIYIKTIQADGTVTRHDGSTFKLDTYTKGETYSRAEIDTKDSLKLNLTGGVLTGPLTSPEFRLSGPTGDFAYIKSTVNGASTSLDLVCGDDSGGQDSIRFMHQGWETDNKYSELARIYQENPTSKKGVLKVTGQIYEDNQRVYSPNNRPTAADVGLGSVDNTADSAKNVLSATKLTTARTINGTSFDGSANITITAASPNTLTRGTGLAGSNYNGSTATTWSVAYGNTAGTAAQGNDARLSDARTPLAHTHAIVEVSGLQGELNSKYSPTNKPTATDVGALPLSGGTMSGSIGFNKYGSCGLASGNGDGASFSTNNIRIESWFGVGIWCTQATPRYSHYFNARSGDFVASGSVHASNSVVASNFVINQIEGSGSGLSLYGSAAAIDPDYGIMFAQSGSYQGHGLVAGNDWATYFNMSGASSRGWVFRHKGVKNCASISADGHATFNGDVTAFSDKRVKANIENIPDALAKVMKLNGVTYTRTDQEDKEKRHTGIIAQEVEEVLPEAVTTVENGDIKDFKSVAYGNLVGLLIEAIKEQQKQIEELKEVINGITNLS